MALSSPGVDVQVINESFYTPAEPGTVPLIVVATAENKQNGAGTGIAAGTTKSNAENLYLITSQRDLVETFGDPIFKTDANSNPIHAGEQNEYGLQAAYSLLGVSNRAYILRADVDLDQLTPQASAPVANPSNGTYWLDTVNSAYGIFEWNSAPASTRNGQSFINKTPIVITDSALLDNSGAPLGSVGSIGDYAIVMLSDWDTLNFSQEVWFRGGLGDGWVLVGSEAWANAWPAITGTVSVTDSTALTVSGSPTVVINGETFTFAAPALDTVGELVAAINGTTALTDVGISVRVDNGKFKLFHGAVNGNNDAIDSNEIHITGTGLSQLGITAGYYYSPRMVISKHTQVPPFKTSAISGSVSGRPTGSVWIKTTPVNAGAHWRIKRFNAIASTWETVDSPIYANNTSAIYELDRSGGGRNIPVGGLYIQSNYNEDEDTTAAGSGDTTQKLANFKAFRRSAVGATSIRIPAITNLGATSFTIRETLAGTTSTNTVTITLIGSAVDSAAATLRIATAINSSTLVNVQAEIDSLGFLVIKHKIGGEIRFTPVSGVTLTALGFVPFDYVARTGVANLFTAKGEGDMSDTFVASLWEPLVFTASGTAPTALTADGQVWYSSDISEIDILINNGSSWSGMRSTTSPLYNADATKMTDPAGPIVAASAPDRQSDGTDLVTGDLWIDTSDLENFPRIYKFNADLVNKSIKARWVLIDTADQTSEEGIVFADARFNTTGASSDVAGSITSLLASDYVDVDAPDPELYPQGMLLWNLRRSGFNVKEFKRDYIDTSADNVRFGDESQADYFPHRWVTISANQADGTGSFGRKAQRDIIVRALQAAVNTNQQIRDNESRTFNVIACPGYPELAGELVSLNYDRGITAFVVADTPARLAADASTLSAWGTNQKLAIEDNDDGLVTSDEYMGFFYPWGLTSDNFGNNVVVPPSHMMLRTIALNDQVAYPWFAPAGVRRGGITNASAVGYVNSNGEFVSVALNEGQRDTLASIKVNPITFITGTGLVNFGQYTRARAASALDRINVARLVVYLRKQLTAVSRPYVFEPNDKITRDEIKAEVDSLLLELVGQRAIYDYLVVCDESNNTRARIDRSELYIDLAIEPVKGVEFIYIPLRLKNTGEIAG